MKQYEASSASLLLFHARKRLEKTSLSESLVNLIMVHSGEIREVSETGEKHTPTEELSNWAEIRSWNVAICEILEEPVPGTFNRDIAEFLSRRREAVDNENANIAVLLKSFEFQNFKKTPFPCFRTFIVSGPKEVNYYFNSPREEVVAAKVLLYGILEMSFQKLGTVGTFKLFNEAIDLYREKYFDDVESPIESLVKAILYCEENLEYPIEWALENAFSDSAVNM